MTVLNAWLKDRQTKRVHRTLENFVFIEQPGANCFNIIAKSKRGKCVLVQYKNRGDAEMALSFIYQSMAEVLETMSKDIL